MPFSRLPPGLRNARRHERDVAASIGGRLTAMSGAGPEKGDVASQILVVECKSTSRASFAISPALMDRITSTAAQTSRRGVLHVRFVDASGRTLRQYGVVEADLLEDLA
ncbi:hypothetical protein [Aureimonas sp. AU40]|uniref:hypothetical protein n=1 Tax=Aureimonas sp. AU40 TaxID=1637747 RepID=UPI0007826B64|nr:hypothetical protein [Aureimonas sp. AU40]